MKIPLSLVLIGGVLVGSLTSHAQSSYEPYFFTSFAGPVGEHSIARFYFAEGAAVDSAHNVYVADTGNHTIRKIAPDGSVITLAGSAGMPGSADGTGSAARFYYPQGVAVDDMGNVYVADTYNFTIRKITPDGIVTALAGLPGSSGGADGTGTAARFNYPQGVAVDSAGNVYVADTDNHTIRKITPAGMVTTFAGLTGVPGSADGTGNVARFTFPQGLTADSGGAVFVADTDNHTIRKITPAGSVSTLAGLAGNPGSTNGTGSAARFSHPEGVAVDGDGNVYVGDTSNFTIRKITSAGVASTLAGLAGSSGSADNTGNAARFNGPQGVAVDTTGNVYVADAGNHTIRNVTPAGVVTTIAGLAGSSGSIDRTDARFFQPQGVAVDSGGNVYVVDTSNHAIRKITPAGVASTLAGLAGASGSADGTGSAARFFYPGGVAVDSGGNVYVADTLNNTIRKITPAGVVSTLAGLAGASGSADGIGSAARFFYPGGVAVDGGGNVYVADSSNSTIRKITPAGVVSTPAGMAGASGSADGTGSAARFNEPQDVAVDSGGNVYVADYANHTIRKITAAGDVSTLAGLAGAQGSADGTGSAARFTYPSGVAVDSAGNVYVADFRNSTIRKITPAGVVSTLAGLAGAVGSADGTGSAARFNDPYDVAVDSGGNVYVADFANSTIRKITPAGVVSTLAGSATIGSADGTGSAARFYYPEGVAVDSANTVFVADTANHTIRKITPAGVVSTLAGVAGASGSADGTGSAARFYHPGGVAVDTGGNVYVADSSNSTIRKITPAGVASTLAGLAGAFGSADGTGSAARFNDPFGVAVDSAGNVYVADTQNYTVRKITPAGVVSTLAGLAGAFGSADGTGSAARFSNFFGVAVDSGGNVYVADFGNHTVRKITPAGVVSTLAGSAGARGSADGTGSAARFNAPEGVAVDSGGNVYVTDSDNYTVRKITPAGVVSTLAGLAGAVGSADGTASAARFDQTKGVAVDSGGNVYVADTFNNSIREGAPPPFIESPPIAIGTVGLQFIYQIEAAGATSFNATNLPPGLTVNADSATLGVIGGTPTAAGTFPVTLSASNGQHTTTATLTITVQNAPSSGPIVGNGSSVKGRTGQPFSFDVFTISGSVTALLAAGGLPPGLSADPVTGLISGIPTADGSSAVTLTVTDGAMAHTTTLQLTFTSDPAVPAIASAPGVFGSISVTITPGQPFSYTITAPSANPTTFGLIGTLPSGLSFDTSTGIISGTYNGGATISAHWNATSAASAPSSDGRNLIEPNTIRIVRPLIALCQFAARNETGIGTVPLNFFEATTFKSWRQLYFTPQQINDPTISCDLCDPDRDGLSNLLEYAFSLNPTTPSTTNRPSSNLDLTYLSLTYTKVLAATDLIYTIEESTDLAHWSPVAPLNQVLTDNGFMQTIRAQVPRSDAGNKGELFLHLRLSH